MSTSRSAISTSRLELVTARVDLSARVVDFYKRNDLHLAPWDPPRPEGFHTEAFQRARMVQAEGDAAAGTAMRWWLYLRNEPEVLVGSIGLTAIARGPFQNAMLGYALDSPLQGQGFMREGLAAVINHAFSSEMYLHRMQANVRPENHRSLRLLEQLGFEREGLAPMPRT
jgi:ribosomal-protein-alanine N-acetyltransferase